MWRTPSHRRQPSAVAGSRRPLGRAFGDRGSLLGLGSDGLGEVDLEMDVEPKRAGERERTLEQRRRSAVIATPEGAPAGGGEPLPCTLRKDSVWQPELRLVGAIALGAVVAPILVSGVGVRGALIAVGMFLPILTVLLWRPLRALDAEAAPAGLELLRSQPIFAPLPAAVLERLASTLSPVPVAAGAEVFHQGDRGELFYMVGRGEVEVLVEGRPATRLGAGEGFGEIALLRDVPRTATVVATRDGELYTLERNEFIAAVTGHSASAEAADAIIAVRLGSLRPGIASV